MALTKRACDAAEPKADEYTLWDGDLGGFGLRVWPSGRKTFVVMYRLSHRKRRITLGAYGSLTVYQARKLARQVVADVAAGIDPAEVKAAARHAPTVKDLCERFDREHIAVHLKPKTQRPYRRLIADRILPAFGSLKVAAVTRIDVARWHHHMRNTPVEANRALALLHKLFNMAQTYGWHEGDNPAAGVQKNREKARKRYLNGDELQRIGQAITELETAEKRPISPFLALAFRLLLLTGMRRDEVLTLEWEYVDLGTAAIRLPDSKTGAKTVPLSVVAVDLLRRAPRQTDSPWVITATTRGRTGEWRHVVSPDKGWRRVKKLASTPTVGLPTVDVSDVTLHDLRHTHASVAVSAGLSVPVIGALLGHADQASTARYTHLAMDPLRQAANIVGDKIDATMKGTSLAEVVDIRTARKSG